MKAFSKIQNLMITGAALIFLTACSEAPEEETAAEGPPTLQAPKRIVKESDNPLVPEVSSNPADGPTEAQEKQWAAEREKRMAEFQNMTEEERQARREEWENMSDEERQKRRDERIAEADINGDGNIGRNEMPSRMWDFMGRADKDGDSMISPEERSDFFAEMQAERALRELSGEGGGDRRWRGGKGGPGGGKGGFGGGKGGGGKGGGQ